MAVSVAQLAVELRLISEASEAIPDGQRETLTRLLDYAGAALAEVAPTAPAALQDQATIRLCGYLFEAPASAAGAGYANALRNSGALSIVSRHIARRAVTITGDQVAGTSGGEGTGTGTGGPSTGGTGEPGVDAQARSGVAANLRLIVTNGLRLDALETFRGTIVGLPGRVANLERFRNSDLANIYNRIDQLRGVLTGGNIGDVLTRVAGERSAYNWRPPTAVDQTARDQAETNRVEIGRNSAAVVTARQEAATADRKAVAAQDAIPAKASDATIDAESDNDDFTTTRGVFRAIARKLTAAAVKALLEGLAGNARLSATAIKDLPTITGMGKVRAVVNSLDTAVIESSIPGEADGDLAIGYTAATVAIFRYAAPPTNQWQEVARWTRAATAGRTDTALEAFIETIVSPWAIQGSAEGIPGPRTFDGLFKSEAQTPIPAANVTITFAVGDESDGDEVDEIDAAATNFAISEEQAAEPGAFLRCRYRLDRISLGGFAPRDIELLLQTMDGTIIGRHNIKDEGSGAAQFPVVDAGQHRWAVRVVTVGSYTGDVIVSGTEYHSAQPLADKPMEHVAEAAVSVEAEKRQAEDARLTAEIARVEQIKSITNGLPAATATRKGNVIYRNDRPYQQTDADAFQVPETGFVQFVLGNIGATGIMRAEDCRNRKQIVYAAGNHEIALNFSATRKAVITAQNVRNNKLSTLAPDIIPNLPSPGLLMLHWAPARAGGADEPAASAAPVLLGAVAGTGFGTRLEFDAASRAKIIAAIDDAATRGLMVIWKFNDPDVSHAYMPLQPGRPAIGAAAKRFYTACVAQNGSVVAGDIRVSTTSAHWQGPTVVSGHSIEIWKVT